MICGKLYPIIFRITTAYYCRIEKIFEDYREAEHKHVIVEEFLYKKKLTELINQSIELYEKMKKSL